MHDIKAIAENPDAFAKAMHRRGLTPDMLEITTLYNMRLDQLKKSQDLQQQRNAISKEIGLKKSKNENPLELMNQVHQINEQITGSLAIHSQLSEKLHNILASLPNVQALDIPDGNSEEENLEIRKVGEPKRQSEKIPEHNEIGEALGMMDFETAAKMSGSRFVLMHSGLARLERALAQFMLDTHTEEHGYTEVSPPLLVKDNAMYGTGQLPKFEDDLFKTSKIDLESFEKWFVEETNIGHAAAMQNLVQKESIGSPILKMHEAIKALFKKAEERFWLIPTSEVSLTNIVAEEIIDEEKLPYRYTAHTPCFRSEAGAAGKDTKGMIRQHQFYKVEMVSITKPEDSAAEHERMTKCAENILAKLGLPFRTIVLCTGDAGFSSHKTYDIEVWLPGQGRYREISSCSNCGDFQARRMNARCRAKGEKNTRFVHTLNGSGVAVGRALIAVLENYYDPADGGVFVPDVLKPYMGGLDKIRPMIHNT